MSFPQSNVTIKWDWRNDKYKMKKIDQLKNAIKQKHKILISFSGGVDSSVLAKIAYDVLGKEALAVTIDSETFPKDELKDSKNVALEIGIPHKIVSCSLLNNKKFVENPVNRCYYCKKEMMKTLRKVAAEKNIKCIADGVCSSDYDEYRPGLKIKSFWHPLSEFGYSKNDVRKIAKKMGLSVHDKPSDACLATRISYNEKITKEKLGMIEKAENIIKDTGVTQVRVRYHKNIARIEVGEKEIKKILDKKTRKRIVNELKKLGFTYITLDLQGYRSGSMDEVL